MFITITDASKGKPFTLESPLDNSCCKQIGIRSISMWVGWYNIYEEQTWRWSELDQDSVAVKLQAGLYSFSDLVDALTSQLEGFTISVNLKNGLIDMTIPDGFQIWLPEAICYLLGLDYEQDWLDAGAYEGDRAVEFSPKRILIYLKQLSTTNNFENKNKKQLTTSQLLGVIPISSESFGSYCTINFENPHFKSLQSDVNELDFDFKIEWGNNVRHKLNNHSQPIDVIVEIK